jgi:hypothetical protein
MHRRHWILLATLATLATLTACGGVPLRAIPRLMQLSGALLEANPAEFRVAMQVDARIAPPAGAVPLLSIQLTPKAAGAFEPVNKKLPLQLATSLGIAPGLSAAPAGRRWLLYSLPPVTQAELSCVQAMVRHAQAQPGYQKGGQLSLGIEQTELAITLSHLANTPWQTWLQVKQSDGYFEIWSGTPAQILALADGKR